MGYQKNLWIDATPEDLQDRAVMERKRPTMYQVTIEFVDGTYQTHPIPDGKSVAEVVATAREAYGVDVFNYRVAANRNGK